MGSYLSCGFLWNGPGSFRDFHVSFQILMDFQKMIRYTDSSQLLRLRMGLNDSYRFLRILQRLSWIYKKKRIFWILRFLNGYYFFSFQFISFMIPRGLSRFLRILLIKMRICYYPFFDSLRLFWLEFSFRISCCFVLLLMLLLLFVIYRRHPVVGAMRRS